MIYYQMKHALTSVNGAKEIEAAAQSFGRQLLTTT
jgi:hypothetical protein